MDPFKVFDLLNQFQGIADEVGMGGYWNQLRREIAQDRQDDLARLATRGQMPAQLSQNRPKPDQVLLIQTLNGRERKIIHIWAERHQYKHKAIQTPLFDPVRVYRCKDCHKSYTKSELRSMTDHSTIFPGHSYGLVTSCFVCDSYYDPGDKDSD